MVYSTRPTTPARCMRTRSWSISTSKDYAPRPWRTHAPSPTLSHTDPVPRGLLTLCPGAYWPRMHIHIYIKICYFGVTCVTKRRERIRILRKRTHTHAHTHTLPRATEKKTAPRPQSHARLKFSSASVVSTTSCVSVDVCARVKWGLCVWH